MTALSADLEAAIVTALRADNQSHNAIARSLGVSQSTVSRVASNCLIPPTNPPPKEALAAKARWDTRRRLGLLDEGFDKLQAMLQEIEKPAQLRDWMVSIGIGIDKARLESDLSTANVAVLVDDKLTEKQRQRIRRTLTGRDD